jgi:hypothetical protein
MVLPETSSLRARRCCFLGPLRARAGSALLQRTTLCRSQHSTLYHARAAEGGARRRREGGTRERGKGRRKSLGLLVARQQELG